MFTTPDEIGWCFIKKQHGSESWLTLFWYFASFYLWVSVCLVAYIILLFKVFLMVFLNNSNVAKPAYDSSKKVTLFLIVILLCWIYPSFYNIYNIKDSLVTYIFTDFLPVSQGTLTALVFYSTNSPTIKYIWKFYGSKLNSLTECLRISMEEKLLCTRESVKCESEFLRQSESMDVVNNNIDADFRMLGENALFEENET